MQCPNCGGLTLVGEGPPVCENCGVNMVRSWQRRYELADRMFGGCTCEDNSCDWCSVVSATEDELDEFEAGYTGKEIKT